MTEGPTRRISIAQPFRIILGVIPLLALIFLLAACGGSPFTAASVSTTSILATTESSAIPPAPTPTLSLPEAISQWRTQCGQTMFAQQSSVTYTVSSDEIKLIGGGDPSALMRDANQALSELDQWQVCVDRTSAFDTQLDTALTNEIKADRGLWQYYAVGDTTSQEEQAAGQMTVLTSRQVTAQLCADGDPVMQSC